MALTTDTAGAAAGTSPHRWWPLAVIASAHLMAVLDTTVMFVALPSVQHSLGMTVTTRQWVVTAYTLAFAALLLPGGRLADRLGARRTLLIGVAGFALASAVGGASADGAMRIAARAVQGAFAALLVSSTKSLLMTVYTGEKKRARAVGIFTATLTAGMAVGLILGGVLTTELGWRWCLCVNVALAQVAIIGGPRVLPAVTGRPGVRIDVSGALLASAGMVALVYGLGEVPSLGWRSGHVIASPIAAAVLLSGFVARQAGKLNPLLPFRVVRDRNRGGALIALIVNTLKPRASATFTCRVPCPGHRRAVQIDSSHRVHVGVQKASSVFNWSGSLHSSPHRTRARRRGRGRDDVPVLTRSCQFSARAR